MSGYAARSELEPDEEQPGHVNVGWVILASLLCGAGLTLTLFWVMTFQWILFPGIGLSAVGFLLLFSERAGLDRAH